MSDVRSWSPTLVSKTGDGGQRYIACRQCGTAICPTSAEWKAHAVLSEEPLARSGAAFSGVSEVLQLRRFFCASCGTTLDTEMAMPGEPFLVDRIME
ncbi:hypothetical protein IB238_22740 [Rhizobium sp. ARZ01]|nr:hypothetical protein [Rhizobium sp. ARZ01]